MTETQFFGAGVRVAGLWLILQGFMMFLAGTIAALGSPIFNVRSFIIPLAMLIVGALVIKAAPRIVKCIYPSGN